MSKAAATRQFIIEKAAAIFNRKGYDGTSLTDIQEATLFSKGAIYGNFSDKNELMVAAYEHNCSLLTAQMDALINAAATAREALLAYTGYYTKNWQAFLKTGGCPMLNAAVEADDHLHFMKDPVRKSMQRVIQRLQRIIEQGQANNEFNQNVVATDYAQMIFSLLEGNMMMAKIMNDPAYLRIAGERISYIIDQELR